LADLRDYPMPLYDGDVEGEHGLPANARAFKDLVRKHDAVAIASPEYNGSFSAVLKNTIDWISRPEPGEAHLAALRGKTAVLLSTSPGAGGGKRGMRHLRELLEMVGVRVIPSQVSVPKSAEAFGPSGELLRADDRGALERAAKELAETVRTAVLAA
jgi:NAD(P)H-dependent FMN reductase